MDDDMTITITPKSHRRVNQKLEDFALYFFAIAIVILSGILAYCSMSLWGIG